MEVHKYNISNLVVFTVFTILKVFLYRILYIIYNASVYSTCMAYIFISHLLVLVTGSKGEVCSLVSTLWQVLQLQC